MDNLEPFYVAAVARCPGLNGSRTQKLIEKMGAARAVWEADWRELLSPGIGENMLGKFAAFRREAPSYPQQLQEQCSRLGIRLMTIWDQEYPLALKEIYEAPAVLYIRGTVASEAPRIAMVGARKFSSYGEAVAREFGEKFAAAGLTVVSGGARGIDTCSHKGALKASGGRTVAVFGCGVDVVYPAENRRLFECIVEQGGALVSEYAPGTQPLPAFFPARNRIIAGLSQGTVVVEAAQRSGSLITAELSLSEGREVYAVPGSIFSKMSEGCHQLLKEGAKLVCSAEDVLEDFGLCQLPGPKQREIKLTPEQRQVYQVLSFEHPLTIDEIIQSLPESEVSTVSFALLQMEMEGIVLENELHAYRRAERE